MAAQESILLLFTLKYIDNITLIPMAYTPETINEQSMRNALTELVKSKIFWGKGAVKQMTIGNVSSSYSFIRIDSNLEFLLLYLGDFYGIT